MPAYLDSILAAHRAAAAADRRDLDATVAAARAMTAELGQTPVRRVPARSRPPSAPPPSGTGWR